MSCSFSKNEFEAMLPFEKNKKKKRKHVVFLTISNLSMKPFNICPFGVKNVPHEIPTQKIQTSDAKKCQFQHLATTFIIIAMRMIFSRTPVTLAERTTIHFTHTAAK